MPRDKVAAAVYQKKRYYDNIVERRADNRRRLKAYYASFVVWMEELKSGPCSDCNNKYPPECMDFDHVRGEKLFRVSRGHSTTKERVLAEIAKCELVCANCHRTRTKSRLGR